MKSESILCILLFAIVFVSVNCNLEGDVLYSWRSVLSDPNNVLQSWDPTLVNPCTWFHITCNNKNSVTRVDLGNAELSGPLVPQLGMLTNLQYLEVYSNKISGPIPQSLGNITGLISLDLYENQLSGPIPTSLGNLKSLRYLRLNGNYLTGKIPDKVIQLIFKGNLLELNVSRNYLAGTVHSNSKIVTTTITQDARA